MIRMRLRFPAPAAAHIADATRRARREVETFSAAVRAVRAAADRDPAFRAALLEAHRRAQEFRSLVETPEIQDLVLLVPGADALAQDEQREEAAKRVVARLGRFIHPARWPIVWPALKRRAEAEGRGPEAVLLAAALDGIFIVAAADESGSSYGAHDAHAVLRAGLNDVVTDDLAGPGWRELEGRRDLSVVACRDVDEDADDGGRDEPMPPPRWRPNIDVVPDVAAIEAGLTVDSLLARAHLPRAEEELLMTLREMGGDLAAAVADLGLRPATARQRLSRARRRLRAVAG